MRRRLGEYASTEERSHVYGELDAIEEILQLSLEDRIGRRLASRPLRAGEVAALDIELWHSGNRAECRAWIDEIGSRITPLGLAITDWYIGISLCLIRATVNGDALQILLDPAFDYIKTVDRRPSPNFEMGALRHVNARDLQDMAGILPDDAVGILVIDSGIASAHPLLAPLIGDTQVTPILREPDTAGDVDTVSGGHGTAVAGIAAFGDIGECLARSMFLPGAILFSARVTNAQNEYDPEFLLEHQLEDAVVYFLDRYPQIHVINLSLGDPDRVYRDDEYQFHFAAAIDELAYRYRDREILFVVSVGNLAFAREAGEELLTNYPAYLLEESSRLIDPGTAAIALTVGGLSYGEGSRLDNRQETSTERLVASERSWPSPFTRTGPGVNGAIKPEVVDFAGDLRFVRGHLGDAPQHAGVPTTSKDFAPPAGSLLRTVAGTSYATPKVSNVAAQLFHAFPGASANLIRALIANSARLPDSRPQAFESFGADDVDILRIYGYGQPDFARARWSAENDVLLVADETIDLDSFALFEVGTLPDNFLSARGSGELAVTLAFDPPTRHTRLDSYLGVNMEVQLFRNSTADQIAQALRAYDRDERERLSASQEVTLRKVKLPSRTELATVDLRPTAMLRKKGTLQHCLARVSTARWEYDGRPLILAVVCRRLWAPEEITTQRFSAIVAVRHDNERVLIHQHLRAQVQVAMRARVRG